MLGNPLDHLDLEYYIKLPPSWLSFSISFKHYYTSIESSTSTPLDLLNYTRIPFLHHITPIFLSTSEHSEHAQSAMPDLKWVMDKVAVENEPGLSNAQLMLTNSDLRPGESKPF